ncbi:AI-2E family transporter [Salinisphaera sp. SPP-AMP-43]|uniref:AI-2E family transporter n=1 Tax=Salinisphaera sp. SPP-AMP-43 TaxID=3121288 RepID=UPI003C6E119F
MAKFSSHNHDLARRVPRWAGIGLFFYASIFALSEAKAFLVPVVLGFLLSMVFAPVRRALERCGISSWLSSLLIVVLLIFGFLGMVAALAMPVSNWVENAPRIERHVERELNGISQSINEVFQANKKLQSMTNGSGGQEQTVEVEKGQSMPTQMALLAPSLVAQLLFTFVLLFFLMASGDMFYEKLVHVMPTFRDKRRAVRIVYNAERKLSRYLFTITLINFGLGVAVGCAMFAYGMPSPLMFGAAAFLLNFVPYVGALFGVVVAGAIALLSFDWYGWPLIVAGTYLMLTTIEGQLITPYFVGRSLRLNTVVVFLAVSFWAWLWSAVGMIVAVPLLVAIRTICEHIEELDHISAFLSERHAEELPVAREDSRSQS